MENCDFVVQADQYFSERTMAELLDEGSLKAFNILYNKYAPALFEVIIRITGGQAVAENILQQTFIELWNNKQTYTPLKERVFTWMFKTARRFAIENLRRQSGSDQKQGIHNLVYSQEAEDYLTGKNKTACIERKTKQALHLIYFKAYSIDEAACELNITVNDLRANLELAVEQLNAVAI